MNGTKLESVQCVKDLGVTVASSLKFSQQCNNATGKANRKLGFRNRNILFKNKDVILPLCISLIRPRLEYTVQFWESHHAKGSAKLEAVQQRTTKMIMSLRNQPYKERLAWLYLFFEKQWLRGKIIECFILIKGFMNRTLARCSQLITHQKQGVMGANLRCKQLQLNRTKFFFTNDVVREWNKLPPLVVQCNTVKSFKNKLDHHLLNQDIW